jgi:hypothetical protein
MAALLLDGSRAAAGCRGHSDDADLTVVVAPFVIVGATLAENADRPRFHAQHRRARAAGSAGRLSQLPLIIERAAACPLFAHDGAGF